MIYKLQAQSGFRRDSMWCGPAAHAVRPSPAERNERGACTFTLSGQRSYMDERERPSKRFGLMQGSRRVTSRSGGGYGLWPATALQQTSPHYRRHLGNPCAEKVRPHRPRQIFGVPETNFGNLPQ